MSLSSPAPPTIQDPGAVAEKQQQYNQQAGVESQAGSNVNQANPYGSVSYSQTGTGPGGVPIYTATTNLNPAQQAILDSLNRGKTTAGAQGGDLLTRAAYGSQNPGDVIGNATSGATADLLQHGIAALTPYYNTQKDQLDTKLRNQGFKPGDTAYDQAINGLSQNQNQSINSLYTQFEPTAYQQAYQNYMTPLTIGLQELGLAQPTSPVSQLAPTNPLSVQPANYTGAVANAQQGAQKTYEDKMAQQTAMMSGLFGIPSSVLGGWAKGGFQGLGAGASTLFGAGAGEGAGLAGSIGADAAMGALALSDRRLKRDVTPVGALPNGLNIYAFKYVWDDVPRVGVMADEVEAVMPRAVSIHRGYKAVDYSMVMA